MKKGHFKEIFNIHDFLKKNLSKIDYGTSWWNMGPFQTIWHIVDFAYQ